MDKGQERAFIGLKNIRNRLPFQLKGIHPDNQNSLMNYHVYEYAKRENIEFARSRPYKKNDNCFVEQKNFTHIRKVVGYLRYGTIEEMNIINDLYRNELRLYKNFFQPVIKLKSKIRIKGKIHKKYSKAKTPYQILMESNQIDSKTKKELKKIYLSLNPADLKRIIDIKLNNLFKSYQSKNNSQKVVSNKKIKPSLNYSIS